MPCIYKMRILVVVWRERESVGQRGGGGCVWVENSVRAGQGTSKSFKGLYEND